MKKVNKKIKQLVEAANSQEQINRRLAEGYVIKQITSCASNYNTFVYALYEKEEIITN